MWLKVCEVYSFSGWLRHLPFWICTIPAPVNLYVSFRPTFLCHLKHLFIESVNSLRNFRSAWNVQCHFVTDVCKCMLYFLSRFTVKHWFLSHCQTLTSTSQTINLQTHAVRFCTLTSISRTYCVIEELYRSH